MKVRIKFTKKGAMSYIGHLDVMRYFQKVIRRAEIPIAFSSGYSPHMIMSFASPLGLGVTSEGEYFDIEMTASISSKEAVARMNATGVEGMAVQSFRQIPSGKKHSGMTILAGASYRVTFSLDRSFLSKALSNKKPSTDGTFDDTVEELNQILESFMAQPEIHILKETKRSVGMVDIKPLIVELKGKSDWEERCFVAEEALAGCDQDLSPCECGRKDEVEKSLAIEMTLAAGSKENLKPNLVMKALCSFLGKEYNEFAYQVHRLEMYANVGDDKEIKLVSLESLGEEIESSPSNQDVGRQMS